ncbi:MAG TPA: type II toxin-antitoxin system RelE/ParE family toxin [Prolixibacteraceae bacterium]|nr:type II toxin-antitoxin system RelE/ParE family toxin [Prolixibacteraceae bacterium]
MKLVYTEQALESLEEALSFITPNVSPKKLIEIRDNILNAADTLLLQPKQGQAETYLAHLRLGHRRLVISHYKIIYRIIGATIYVTDIFDSRQDPDKMK